MRSEPEIPTSADIAGINAFSKTSLGFSSESVLHLTMLKQAKPNLSGEIQNFLAICASFTANGN